MAEYMNDRYYAGKGTTALGIIGTALGGLATAGGGMNILGGGVNSDYTDVKTENAILKSELNTERKMVDIYTDLGSKINALETKVDANAAAQSVINCGMQSATAVLQTQVAGILGMTKMVIPSTNICTASSTDSTTTA